METHEIPGSSEDGISPEDTSTGSPVQGRSSPEGYDEADTWLSLREASEKADVSVSALRQWFRAEKIQSRLESGPTGDMRMVLLSEVIAQAGQRQASQPGAAVFEKPSAPPWPDDVLPIPKDAWNKMLEQLGNLHEAGQQLAEMAAGKAKAETQVEFLRERVTDLREQLEESRRSQLSLDYIGEAEENLEPGEPDEVDIYINPLPIADPITTFIPIVDPNPTPADQSAQAAEFEDLPLPEPEPTPEPEPEPFTEAAVVHALRRPFEPEPKSPWWQRALRREP